MLREVLGHRGGAAEIAVLLELCLTFVIGSRRFKFDNLILDNDNNRQFRNTEPQSPSDGWKRLRKTETRRLEDVCVNPVLTYKGSCSLHFLHVILRQDSVRTYKVKLRRVRLTTVAVQKQ